MSSSHGFGGQLTALALASIWPVAAIGLVVASWIGELMPYAVRSRIARRGPKAPFSAARLAQGRRA